MSLGADSWFDFNSLTFSMNKDVLPFRLKTQTWILICVTVCIITLPYLVGPTFTNDVQGFPKSTLLKRQIGRRKETLLVAIGQTSRSNVWKRLQLRYIWPLPHKLSSNKGSIAGKIMLSTGGDFSLTRSPLGGVRWSFCSACLSFLTRISCTPTSAILYLLHDWVLPVSIYLQYAALSTDKTLFYQYLACHQQPWVTTTWSYKAFLLVGWRMPACWLVALSRYLSGCFCVVILTVTGPPQLTHFLS